MKTTNWKDIAELIGIASIVASLIFVGFQMRQNHEIALVTLYQMRADAARDVMIGMLESDDLRDAFEKYEIGEEPPDFGDVYSVQTYMNILLNHFENAHFLYLRGFLTEEHWQSDVANLTGTLGQSVTREIWHEEKRYYRPSFVEAIDKALAEREPPTGEP